MKTLLKALLHDLLGKRGLLLLVLFAVMASSTLIFANSSFAGTVEQMFHHAAARWSGSADLIVSPRSSDPDTLSDALLTRFDDEIDFVDQVVLLPAFYVTDEEGVFAFTLMGVDLQTYEQRQTLTLNEGEKVLGQNEIIVGQAYADRLGWALGDTIELSIDQKAELFKIVGISAPTGLFSQELSHGGFILINLASLSKSSNVMPNIFFITLRETADKDAVYRDLTQAYPSANVRLSIDEAIRNAETSHYVLPFRMSSVAIYVLCGFIIVTSYHLVLMARTSTIGILQTIGCRRRTLLGVFSLESLLIGLLGGVAGCLMGMLVVQVGLLQHLYFSDPGLSEGLITTFRARDFLVTLFGAMLISFLSSAVPIFRTLRQSAIAVVRHAKKARRLRHRLRGWIGLIIIMTVIVGAFFLPMNFFGMIVANIFVTAMLGVILILSPSVVHAASRLLTRLFARRAPVWLGFRNARDNRRIHHSVALFAITLATVILVSTICHTLTTDLHKSYEALDYSLSFSLRDPSEEAIDDLIRLPEVDAAYISYESYMHTIRSHDSYISTLFGIDDAQIFDYLIVGQDAVARATAEKIGDGDHIILTEVLRAKLGLDIGDTIDVEFEDGPQSYTIIAFVETNYGMGHIGYISKANYLQVAATTPTMIYVKTADDANALKTKMSYQQPNNILSIQTKEDSLAANRDKVDSVFRALNSYTYFLVLVGAVGIANNMLAGFLERKRRLALYTCVGMSQNMMRKMLLSESLMIGVVGVVLGLFSGAIMLVLIPAIAAAVWGKVNVTINIVQWLILTGSGFILIFMAAYLPAWFGRKKSVMDQLKYE